MAALVYEERARQGGTAGWRPIWAAIERREAGGEANGASIYLVQQETARQKKAGRAKARRAIEKRRVGHVLLVRDGVWSGDTVHLCRLPDHVGQQAEVMTDRGSTATVAASAGGPKTAKDVVAALESGKRERGGLPLVYQSDNGPIETAEQVEAYLAREKVIHLLSRVHTPTDNPVAENRNGELEREAGLGKGTRLRDALEAPERLEAARRRLDHHRLRASRGYKTAAQLDREMVRADAIVNREEFYDEACAAMGAAALGQQDLRARRDAEQRALWDVLVRHGLAITTIGVRRVPDPGRGRRRPVTEVSAPGASASPPEGANSEVALATPHAPHGEVG